MQFNKGDKVRVNIMGSKTIEVMKQVGCQVFCYDGNWYHPSNLIKVGK